MNKYRIGAFLCLLVGAGSLFVHIRLSGKAPGASNDSQKINLAIRQAAHHLYKSMGDNQSMIAPVEELETGVFTVQFNQSIYYDTLPTLLNQAFADYEITANYRVLVENCTGDSLLLGYNYLAFQRGQVPCQGRELQSTCNVLRVIFDQPVQEANNSYLLLLGMLGLLGGLVVYIFQPKQPKETQKYTIANNNATVQIVRLGNTFFDSENLTTKFAEKEKTLTFRESKLLAYLAQHPNQVLTREAIQEHVWNDEGIIVGRSLDVFISRLRKILRSDERLSIKNIHGVGYRLEIKD